MRYVVRSFGWLRNAFVSILVRPFHSTLEPDVRLVPMSSRYTCNITWIGRDDRGTPTLWVRVKPSYFGVEHREYTTVLLQSHEIGKPLSILNLLNRSYVGVGMYQPPLTGDGLVWAELMALGTGTLFPFRRPIS